MYSKQQIKHIITAQETLQQKEPMTYAHLLNGEMMFEQFKKHDLMTDGYYAPFNEAMCFGDVSEQIFNDPFIQKRCMTHHVSAKEYHAITLNPLSDLLNSTFDKLVLWFGTDMFCQMNLLTCLAYLEQIKFDKEVLVHVFDEEVFNITCYDVDLNGFDALYQAVLRRKEVGVNVPFSELREGIKLYLNYQCQDNELTTFITDHIEVRDEELVTLLLTTFPQYGLGDTQYLVLIDKLKKSHFN